MPKVKTHSGAKKRFSVTGSGRIKREKAFQAHILTSKSKKRKRNLRQSDVAGKAGRMRLVVRDVVMAEGQREKRLVPIPQALRARDETRERENDGHDCEEQRLTTRERLRIGAEMIEP